MQEHRARYIFFFLRELIFHLRTRGTYFSKWGGISLNEYGSYVVDSARKRVSRERGSVVFCLLDEGFFFFFFFYSFFTHGAFVNRGSVFEQCFAGAERGEGRSNGRQ